MDKIVFVGGNCKLKNFEKKTFNQFNKIWSKGSNEDNFLSEVKT